MFNLLWLPETLPESKRKMFKGIANPLKCFSIFAMGTPMRKLIGVTMLQWCTEGKPLVGIRNLWLQAAVSVV